MQFPYQHHVDLAYFRARAALRQARSDSHERPLRDDFKSFYNRLPDRRNALFMFFTGNLLHWVVRACKFVPQHVNLVLLGSDLSPDELGWLEANNPRPFHHISERIDDNTALDLIFEHAEHDFGWLHIDCFVLNPRLFDDMRRLPDDVAINCIWTQPGFNDLATLHSAFVFFNYRVLATLRQQGIEVYPGAFHYQGTASGRTETHRPLFSRIPNDRHLELLSQVLPMDSTGLPRYPKGCDYFQVLVLYQLVANALGYRLQQVRSLVRDGSGSADSFSSEIIHANGAATYQKRHEAKADIARFYPLHLQVDYALLLAAGADLPTQYNELRANLEAALARLGLPLEKVTAQLKAFLISKGVSDRSCAQVLGYAA
ncbi:MAG: hypothetical protein AAF560_14965 [Acidobacteriota bacterium]